MSGRFIIAGAVGLAGGVAIIALLVVPPALDWSAMPRTLGGRPVVETRGYITAVEPDAVTVAPSSLGFNARRFALEDSRILVGDKEGGLGDLRVGANIVLIYEARPKAFLARWIGVDVDQQALRQAALAATPDPPAAPTRSGGDAQVQSAPRRVPVVSEPPRREATAPAPAPIAPRVAAPAPVASAPPAAAVSAAPAIGLPSVANATPMPSESAKGTSAKAEPPKWDAMFSTLRRWLGGDRQLAAKPDPGAKPQSVTKPEPPKPEAAKAEVRKPEAAKAEPPKLEPVKPAPKIEAAKAEPAKSEPAKPEPPVASSTANAVPAKATPDAHAATTREKISEPHATKPQHRPEAAASKPHVTVDAPPARPATHVEAPAPISKSTPPPATTSGPAPASSSIRDADDPGAVIDWLLRESGRN